MGTLCKIDGCGNLKKTKGLCIMHYHRLLRHGDPLGGGKFKTTVNGEPYKFAIDVLSSDTDECIFWPYAKSYDGPGVVSVNGVNRVVHQFVCENVNGPRPEGHVTRHLCGNGHLSCCNPRHLAWGTPKQNLDDRKLHGTLYFAGTQAAQKLKPDEVLEIYRRDESPLSLAKEFLVTRQTIHRIKNGLVHAKLTGHKKKEGGD